MNGLKRCGVAGSWTRHAVRVCHSRLARSSRWFYAGGGRLVGRSVHAVHGPYNGSKVRGHSYSLKEASGKANCLIQDRPEGCGISCRHMHFAGEDSSTCGRQNSALGERLVYLQDMRWV